MAFQTIEYLIFLSITFILYWTLCKKNKNFQNILIIAASLIFYGWWDWRFLSLLLLTALSSFYAGLWIERTEGSLRKQKTIFLCAIGLNIGILFFFKYYNFFVQAFVDALNLAGLKIGTSTLKIILPVGISFYTFTALSYVIDIFQKKINATKDMAAYLAYVTFFPSILSGPISRAQKQLPQYFGKRKFSYDKAVESCKLAIMGGGNEVMSGRPSGDICRRCLF